MVMSATSQVRSHTRLNHYRVKFTMRLIHAHIGHQFSDHKFIHAVLTTAKPEQAEMAVKYWKIKNINIDKFQQ